MGLAEADGALVAEHVVADADADLVGAGEADPTLFQGIILKTLRRTAKTIQQWAMKQQAQVARYFNGCYTCPRSSLRWVLRKVFQRPETRAKAGVCAANIVILSHGGQVCIWIQEKRQPIGS